MICAFLFQRAVKLVVRTRLHEEAATFRGPHGQTPLHWALADDGCGCSLETIRMILGAHPGAVKVRDKMGRTPLYVAIEHRRPQEVIDILLEFYPDAAKANSQCQFSYTPLHRALTVNYNPRLQCELLKDDSNIPLHIITSILNSCPEAAKVQDSLGRTPLYLAIEHRGSAEITSVLLSFYPEAATIPDNFGRTPLSAAPFWRERGHTITRAILGTCPEAAMVPNEDGETRLHVAVAGDFSLEYIKVILEKVPEAARVRDHWGRTPLSLALTKRRYRYYSAAIIRSLLDAAPDALRMQDAGGSTPLHLAMLLRCPVEIARLFLHECPWAVVIRGSGGSSPFQRAIEDSNRGFGILANDIIVASDAVAMVDKDTGLFPFMIAAAGQFATVSAIYDLLRFRPDVIKGVLASIDPHQISN